MKKITLICLGILSASVAFSHPGHGTGNPLSPGHYVTSPEHALPLALLIAAVVVFINWVVYRIQQKFEKK